MGPLGGIHLLIHDGEKLFGVACGGIKPAAPHSQGEGVGCLPCLIELIHILLDLQHNTPGCRFLIGTQQHHKLVPRIAHRKTAGRDRVRQDASDVADGIVPLGMTVQVVDALKVVHIKHDAVDVEL